MKLALLSVRGGIYSVDLRSDTGGNLIIDCYHAYAVYENCGVQNPAAAHESRALRD